MTKTKECRKKKKKTFVLSSSLRIPDPALLLRDPDFLSTCLGSDSLIPLFSFRRIMWPLRRIIWPLIFNFLLELIYNVMLVSSV